MKKKIIIATLLLAVLVAVFFIGRNGLNRNDEQSQENPTSTDVQSEAVIDEEGYSVDLSNISYEEKDMGEMLEELRSNSSKATRKYNEAFIEVTAVLNDRDIEAGWFDFRAEGDNEGKLLFTCKTLDENVLDAVAKMKLGTTHKIYGQVVNIDKDYGYDLVLARIE